MLFILNSAPALPKRELEPSADRPKRLQKKARCDLWIGRAQGNDPSVSVELSICSDQKGNLTGTLQWSSMRSGWSRRKLKGFANKNEYFLSDESFFENQPKKGWRFCLIDEYKLIRNDNKLSGSYFSKECNDSAKLNFVLQ